MHGVSKSCGSIMFLHQSCTTPATCESIDLSVDASTDIVKPMTMMNVSTVPILQNIASYCSVKRRMGPIETKLAFNKRLEMIDDEVEFIDSDGDDAYDEQSNELSTTRSPDTVFTPMTPFDSPATVCSESESLPFMDLLLRLESSEQDWTLENHGYSMTYKICDTLQGELYKCRVEKNTLSNAKFGSFVAIKKIDKVLFDEKIAIKEEMTYLVDEDIVRESKVLKHLTSSADNGEHAMSKKRIVQFHELFETDRDFYLVMEYVEGERNLADFVTDAFELMEQHRLTRSEYDQTIKHLMYQLITTLRWLHNVQHCTHLNLCMENVLITNSEWMRSTDGLYKMNQDINIKLSAFGVAELCDITTKNPYKFTKSKYLSFERGALISPQMYEDRRYDGRLSDMWSIGMIFYECVTGKPLYTPEDMWDEPNGGYLALKQRKLKKYLMANDEYKLFEGAAFNLLLKLLKRNESKRIKAETAIKHKWFKDIHLSLD